MAQADTALERHSDGTAQIWFPDVAFIGLRAPLDVPVSYLDAGTVADGRQLEIVGFLEQPGQPGVSAAYLPVEVNGTSGRYRLVDARNPIPGGLSGFPCSTRPPDMCTAC
jgi:hypothetical protein